MVEVAVKMGQAVLIISGTLLSARWIVPKLLQQVVQTRSRELFITTIILLCLGIALLTANFGLSLALGAFLAGLVISESEYAHQATADVLPFKDSFIGLFFVSVGMLMNIGYMGDNCLKIAVAVTLIFGLKVITGFSASVLAGSPLSSSIHAGLGLAQVGEFSFVLAIAGRAAGLITEDFYQIFLSSSVVTMMITPFVPKGCVAGLRMDYFKTSYEKNLGFQKNIRSRRLSKEEKRPCDYRRFRVSMAGISHGY